MCHHGNTGHSVWTERQVSEYRELLFCFKREFNSEYLCSGKTKLVDIICTLTNEYCNVDTIDDTVTGSFQQIDLNRHLEEIAQNIEAILIQHLQAIVLDEVQAMRSSRNFLQIIRAWEDFVALNSKQNGKESVLTSHESHFVTSTPSLLHFRLHHPNGNVRRADCLQTTSE